MIQTISTGYTPRPYQIEIHKSLKRFNVLSCHRRFGKTHLSINEIIDKGYKCAHPNPQYAYLAPNYGQAKRVAWDVVKQYTKNLPGVTYNETELKCEFSRGSDRVRILLLGAENPDSLRGIYLDGVVLDEYASMNATIWSEVIRPALLDRLGWAIFISTPKGLNNFYEVYQAALKDANWYAATFRASETGIIPISELEMARATMSESEYSQEFECSWSAALVGAYYGKEIEQAEKDGRITSVPFDPALGVHGLS